MKKIKLFLIPILCVLYSSCSVNEPKMNEIEQYIANKYKAENVSLDTHSQQTNVNGEWVTNESKDILTIKNPIDIEKIIVDKKYASLRANETATFMSDSIHREGIPSEKLQVIFMKSSGSIFTSKTKVKYTFQRGN